MAWAPQTSTSDTLQVTRNPSQPTYSGEYYSCGPHSCNFWARGGNLLPMPCSLKGGGGVAPPFVDANLCWPIMVFGCGLKATKQ